MIGASGPSISIMTLSTLSPASAASRCSTVATEASEESPSTVHNSVCETFDHFASIRRSRPFDSPVRRNTIPELTSAGMENEINRSIRMHAETGNRHAVADRRLSPELDQTQFP